MIKRLYRHLRDLPDRLWVRVVALALLSVLAALGARLLGRFIPDGLSEAVGADSVRDLLKIIANSMLSVTTFSLAVIVTIHRSVSSQWTPRAHRMLLRDTPTQNVLATFVGAYIYALLSLVLLFTPYFTDKGIVVLFGITLAVIALIVVTILRWILHLQTWGSLIDTNNVLEEAARKSLQQRVNQPFLGANPLVAETVMPDDAQPFLAQKTGYIKEVYLGDIAALARKRHALVYLTAPVGRFVHVGDVLGYVAGRADDLLQGCAKAFDIGTLRSPEQDPRFAIIMLAEVASKALSPGINDMGTAIDVIGRLTRVLEVFRDETTPNDKVKYPEIWCPPISADDLMIDAFHAISRDGAALAEVQIVLQKRLSGLARSRDAALAAAAGRAARSMVERAGDALSHQGDRDRLAAASFTDHPMG